MKTPWIVDTLRPWMTVTSVDRRWIGWSNCRPRDTKPAAKTATATIAHVPKPDIQTPASAAAARIHAKLANEKGRSSNSATTATATRAARDAHARALATTSSVHGSDEGAAKARIAAP